MVRLITASLLAGFIARLRSDPRCQISRFRRRDLFQTRHMSQTEQA